MCLVKFYAAVFSFDEKGQGTMVDHAPKILNFDDVRLIERCLWMQYDHCGQSDQFEGDFIQITYRSGAKQVFAISLDEFFRTFEAVSLARFPDLPDPAGSGQMQSIPLVEMAEVAA